MLLGAFAAGVLFRLLLAGAPERDAEIVESKLEAVGYGFLVPIFFINTGVTFDLAALFADARTLLLAAGVPRPPARRARPAVAARGTAAARVGATASPSRCSARRACRSSSPSRRSASTTATSTVARRPPSSAPACCRSSSSRSSRSRFGSALRMPRAGHPSATCTCPRRGDPGSPGMLGTAAPVAQRIEQEPSNLLVAGSIPAGGTFSPTTFPQGHSLPPGAAVPAPALSEPPGRLAAWLLLGDRLVWIDCEMTGLDLEVDELVEIAVVITDFELRPVDPGLRIVIKPDASALENMSEFVHEDAPTSGLLDEIPHGVSVADAEFQVLEYIQQFVPLEGKAPLAGNTIGTDRMFLAKYMPRVDRSALPQRRRLEHQGALASLVSARVHPRAGEGRRSPRPRRHPRIDPRTRRTTARRCSSPSRVRPATDRRRSQPWSCRRSPRRCRESSGCSRLERDTWWV